MTTICAGKAVRWDGLRGRDFLTLDELDGQELVALARSAIGHKNRSRTARLDGALAGRHVALIFKRQSLRTRSAFAIAIADAGGQAHFLDPDEIRLGTKETVRDIARVMSRMYDLVVMRCGRTAELQEFAHHLAIPLWNAMTDDDHPTQAVADLATLIHNGIEPGAAKIAFLGHGRGNVVRSLMRMSAMAGIDIAVAAPPGLGSDPAYIRELAARPGAGDISCTTDVAEAVDGANCVYADMWSNTDDPQQDVEAEVTPFQPYRVTPRVMSMASPRAIFLHCMPSIHSPDSEYARLHPTSLDTDDLVFEGPQSKVMEQAEFRVHAVRALLRKAFDTF